MTARILRVAVRTLGLPISLCVAAFQQSRYGQYGIEHNLVAEDLRSVGREWLDLGVTLFAVPVIGFVNTLAPTAISTRGLAEFYSERITQTAQRNQNFTAARDAYYAAQRRQHLAWQQAQQAE